MQLWTYENGKAERFIQSALREWAYGTVYNHSTERAAMLDRWIHHYNPVSYCPTSLCH
jgi:transposase InsO family protein